MNSPPIDGTQRLRFDHRRSITRGSLWVVQIIVLCQNFQLRGLTKQAFVELHVRSSPIWPPLDTELGCGLD